MDRAEWLKKIRLQTEAQYDHLAPAYWDKYGFYPNATHLRFVQKLLGRLKPRSYILDAACGAGRYDGELYNAGHTVVGVDQSALMLAKARDHFPLDRFPRLSYLKLGLQEMDFSSVFDGLVCIDAMEHIFPEDWPRIVANFHRALKPGGVIYVSVEMMDPDEVRQVYERAMAMGLPVVYGELADTIEAAHTQIMAMKWQDIPDQLAGESAYHYYPALEQVREWFNQAGLNIDEEAAGDGYAHFLAKKVM
jgi:SAM-dependent methyltransferase